MNITDIQYIARCISDRHAGPGRPGPYGNGHVERLRSYRERHATTLQLHAPAAL